MSEAIETPRNESLPAEKFLRSAVFFLVVTSVVMLISTGKLDLFSCVVAPVALLYKGYRWWRNKTPEISQTLATRLVVGYVAIFPIDVLFLSRSFVADSTNPGLYAALLSAVHFLLFVMLVRLFSARTDRDTQFHSLAFTFAAILASRGFDGGHHLPGAVLRVHALRSSRVCTCASNCGAEHLGRCSLRGTREHRKSAA